MTEVLHTLDRRERLRSSINGNPRWRLHLVGGLFVDSASDASVGYDLDNAEWYGTPVLLDLNGRGLVVGIRHPGMEHQPDLAVPAVAEYAMAGLDQARSLAVLLEQHAALLRTAAQRALHMIGSLPIEPPSEADWPSYVAQIAGAALLLDGAVEGTSPAYEHGWTKADDQAVADLRERIAEDEDDARMTTSEIVAKGLAEYDAALDVDPNDETAQPGYDEDRSDPLRHNR